MDLVFTSPPYAGKRAECFDTVSASSYCNWFLPISGELMRVLKPHGSFVMNIKEGVENGERQTYVMELVLALRW